MGNRKSQISIFVIIGVSIVVFILLFGIYQSASKKKSLQYNSEVTYLDSKKDLVQSYVDQCLQEKFDEAIEQYGFNKRMIESHLNENLDSCVDWEYLTQQGMEFDRQDVIATAEITDNNVNIMVDYLIEISRGESKIHFNEFSHTMEIASSKELPQDENGIVTKDTRLSSNDEIASVLIPNGTKITDNLGNPMTDVDLKVNINQKSPDSNIIGQFTYTIEPHGISFDPPITLKIEYDEENIEADIDETSLSAAWFDEDKKTWINFPSVVHADEDYIEAEVEHFSTVSLQSSDCSCNCGSNYDCIFNCLACEGKYFSKSLGAESTGRDLTGCLRSNVNINIVKGKVSIDGYGFKNCMANIIPDFNVRFPSLHYFLLSFAKHTSSPSCHRFVCTFPGATGKAIGYNNDGSWCKVIFHLPDAGGGCPAYNIVKRVSVSSPGTGNAPPVNQYWIRKGGSGPSKIYLSSCSAPDSLAHTNPDGMSVLASGSASPPRMGVASFKKTPRGTYMASVGNSGSDFQWVEIGSGTGWVWDGPAPTVNQYWVKKGGSGPSKIYLSSCSAPDSLAHTNPDGMSVLASGSASPLRMGVASFKKTPRGTYMASVGNSGSDLQWVEIGSGTGWVWE